MNIAELIGTTKKVTLIYDDRVYTVEESVQLLWFAGQEIKEMLIAENDIIVTM